MHAVASSLEAQVSRRALDANVMSATGLRVSRHAQSRMRQRGVPAAVLECLLDCGAEVHDHHGAEILYFSKDSRRRVLRRGKEYVAIARELAKYRGVYAVVGSDGRVATVGWRRRRIRR